MFIAYISNIMYSEKNEVAIYNYLLELEPHRVQLLDFCCTSVSE